MKRLAAALLITLLIGGTAPAWSEDVGQATRVQRFAYQTPPQQQKTALYRFGKVERNARLETVASGALEVTFTDGSHLTLGSSSAMVVDNYVFDSQQNANQTLNLTRGLFRFVSGAMPKDKVRLQTPTVSIGIRGTTIKAQINDNGSETIFFEHGVGFISNAKGQTVEISEGQLVTVSADGSISLPTKSRWNSGDHAIDQGLQAFGQVFGGPGAGSGGNGGFSTQPTGNAATSP